MRCSLPGNIVSHVDFTRSVPLTLTAFYADSKQVGQTFSAFTSNMALSGDPGSNPNQLLFVASAQGMSSVTIFGDPAGISSVLVDATTSSMPEPNAFIVILAVCIGFATQYKFQVSGTGYTT